MNDINTHVFHIFPILTKKRNELQQFLAENGVQTIVHYPIPPHKQECCRDWNSWSFPVTEQIHSEELSLPISPVLANEEVNEVIRLINTWKS